MFWDPYAEFETAVLPNGLSIYVAHWPNKPWVAANFLVHSGARSDPSGLPGVAHFVEHMCSRNACIPYRQIKTFFENAGGAVMLGVTSRNYTYYNFFCPVLKFEEALGIFGSMLVTAQLDEHLGAQRSVIQQEYQKANRLQIDADLKWRKHRALYGTRHWMSESLTPLGTPESVAQITLDDLRKYYDDNYTPPNTSVICVGGMSLGDVVATLSASPFGVEKGGVRTLLPAAESCPYGPNETFALVEFSKLATLSEPLKSAEYGSAALIPGGLNRAAVNMALQIISRIFFEEIREKRGWTYATNAGQWDASEFREINLSVKALSLEGMPHIVEVVEECLTQASIREDLLEEMVTSSLNSLSMLDPTAREISNQAREEIAHHGRIITLAEDEALYSSITMDDIREVLHWLRPEHRYTTLIVP